jgi:hypothetical protein
LRLQKRERKKGSEHVRGVGLETRAVEILRLLTSYDSRTETGAAFWAAALPMRASIAATRATKRIIFL